MAPDIKYNADEHRYWIDEREFPSVTTVLKAEGIIRLAGNPDVLENARDRGTNVHEALALYDQNDLDENSLAPDIPPYVEAWTAFRKSSGFEPDPEMIERKIYHRNPDFIGRMDRWGRAPCGMNREMHPVLPDIKTGAQRPSDVVQIAAYARAAAHTFSSVETGATIRAFDRMWLVYLHPGKGKGFTVVNVSWAEAVPAYNLFLSALNTYNWKGEHYANDSA